MIGDDRTVLVENEKAQCLSKLEDVGKFTTEYRSQTQGKGKVILSNSPNPDPIKEIGKDYDELIAQIYELGWNFPYNKSGYKEMFENKIAPKLAKAKVEDVIFQFSFNAKTKEGRIDPKKLSDNFVDFKGAFDDYYSGETFNAGIWMTQDLSYFQTSRDDIFGAVDSDQSMYYIFDELVNRLKMLRIVDETFNSNDVDMDFRVKFLDSCAKYTRELSNYSDNDVLPVLLKRLFVEQYENSDMSVSEISRDVRDMKK